MEVALTRHKSNYSASGQNRKQGRLCWGAGRRWQTPTRAQSLLHILSTTALPAKQGTKRKAAKQQDFYAISPCNARLRLLMKRVGLGSALAAGVALLLTLGSCW